MRNNRMFWKTDEDELATADTLCAANETVKHGIFFVSGKEFAYHFDQ